MSPAPGAAKLRRRWLIGFVAVALVITVVIVDTTVSAARSNSRRAFISYVNTYVGNWSAGKHDGRPRSDRAWARAHPGAVLAEGNRACTWLAGQDDAPEVDPSGVHEQSRLAFRYLHANRAPAGTPLARLSRQALVIGAWNHLCHSDLDDKTAPESEYHDD